MRKLAAVLAVVVLTAVPVLAERREISPDNPFVRQTIDLYPLIVHYRAALKTNPIAISERNPFDGRYFHLLWLLGQNEQGLRQMWEALKEFAPTTLKQLTTIPYFGSPRTLFRILLLFRFPDEEQLAKKGFFVVEQPDWWMALPRGF